MVASPLDAAKSYKLDSTQDVNQFIETKKNKTQIFLGEQQTFIKESYP